ncbi:MAG: ParA family protein [Bacilli bacterium]|nr:ParA family protein [Bacilli bacterium]
MGQVITIANPKGGVGKTTTTINLGAGLGNLKQKVLLVDLDIKANLTTGLGIDRENIDKGIFDILIKKTNIKDSIVSFKRFDLVPNNCFHKQALSDNHYNFEELKKHLDIIKKEYDYVLIDTGPVMGVLLDMALYASDSVLIPTECQYFAYDGIKIMINKINAIQGLKTKIQENLVVEGILLTKFDNRNVFSYEMAENIKEIVANKVFKTVINYSSHLQEAPSRGKDVLSFSYNSIGSREYRLLAKEILERKENTE